jgi:hypothetical protein
MKGFLFFDLKDIFISKSRDYDKSKKCKLLRGGNLKTLHLSLMPRKNRSHPTLETVKSSLLRVSCLHGKTFSANPIYTRFTLTMINFYRYMSERGNIFQ